MKVVAFMPLKLNNERTKGKNTKLFDDGTPLFHVLLGTLHKLYRENIIDEIYTFCSDEKIKEYPFADVRFLKRPQYLDSNQIRCNDIIKAFLDLIDADIYVMSHATSPFISYEHMKDCIQAVRSGKYDSAFAAEKLQRFMWYRNKPLNFSHDNAPRTQDMEPYFCELSTPYVFTKAVFNKTLGRTGDNPYICECSEIECIDIDYPDDFELANLVYMNIFKNKINTV